MQNTVTREFVVIEELNGETQIVGYFNTLNEATTYTGIEALQYHNEGVNTHIYRREA